MFYKETVEKKLIEMLKDKVEYTNLNISTTRGYWHDGLSISLIIEDKLFMISFNDTNMGCGIVQMHHFSNSIINEKTAIIVNSCIELYNEGCTYFICTLGDNYKEQRKLLEEYWGFKELAHYHNKRHHGNYMQKLYYRDMYENKKAPTKE